MKIQWKLSNYEYNVKLHVHVTVHHCFLQMKQGS